jgi:hypothetical protein
MVHTDIGPDHTLKMSSSRLGNKTWRSAVDLGVATTRERRGDVPASLAEKPKELKRLPDIPMAPKPTV